MNPMINVFSTQALFGVLMQAMAHPGRVLPAGIMGDPPLLDLICATLLDQEAGLAVIGPGDQENLLQTLTLLTGCRQVPLAEADFIIVIGGTSQAALAQVRVGSLEYPDQGATLIYPVDGLNTGTGIALELQGPGIRDAQKLCIDGMAQEDLLLLRDLNSHFPQGVDLLACTADHIVALPRSTKLQISEKG
jgi:alpha-D-ribose 1-methylphosphonate 5-triphosphate synthase subunit PhnH